MGMHIKGSWYTNGSINNADQHLIIDEETGQNIAICYGIGSLEESTANADLIAAAPELLEALKEVLGCVNSYNICDQINTEEARELAETLADVYRVICRAEGKN